ncbi:helix-turn-helix domain-containing protein [Hungatella hathewayi]|uniref:helix-turn-helix domain-containing protein n=1 Tax=Hungatella hathewayi TaxID=154046 RepID=UPI00033FA79D|nr:helix-turn-helix domain-containing protein [Hungatella hathewayi]CCZ58248.1 transcriptional regulator MerR family [Hungatella hathewayi CAG:224]
MAEIHYLISDASKKVDVESHVLRYWEDELELAIPRNEMGHRYYTEAHIRLFQQIKELKEKGYQLKAIKTALDKIMEDGKDPVIPDELLEESVTRALKESAVVTDSGDGETGLAEVQNTAPVMIAQEKMEQFQEIMNHIIGRALEVNNEQLSQDVSSIVNDKVVKELEYLMRVKDEKEEERFKQLDELLRSYQKDNKGRAEAAASKIPFFNRKKKFGRNGKKL